MSKRLDELYFKWLYGQVCSTRSRDPSRCYWTLMGQLFTKDFVWLIPNDDNRAEDGRDLRYEFLETKRHHRVDSYWLRQPCSMLEMLIALSRRLSFSSIRGGEPRDWFWILMDNLELSEYNDETPIPEEEVNDDLERVIWRVYNKNGVGGLFPLMRSRRDQRKLELWQQLSEYLLEQGA